MELENLRCEIDKIDKEIIELLWKRFVLVNNVAEYKKTNNLAPFQASRWQNMLDERIRLGKQTSLPEELIVEIWEAIHKHALNLEASIINK